MILVLLAAKNDGLAWRSAWARAVRATQPPRDLDEDVAAQLAEDRGALVELRPALRAAYEGRAMTAAERAETDRSAEHRIAA